MSRFLWILCVFSLFFLVLAGCGNYPGSVTGSSNLSTQNSWNATATRVAAEATGVALNVSILQAENAVQSADATADVYRGMLTATAQAIAIESTAQSAQHTQFAAATGTQQGWTIIGWTATADAALSTQTALASATAYAWTQQAVDRQATADAASVIALATAQAAQAGIAGESYQQESIRTERQSIMKYAVASLPFVLLFIAVVMGVFIIRYWASFRVIPRAADGSIPIILINNRQMLNPDRSLDPVLDIKNPALPDQSTQVRITENDQKIQGIRAISSGSAHRRTAARLLRGFTRQSEPENQPQIPEITIIDAGTARPMIADVTPEIRRRAIMLDREEE